MAEKDGASNRREFLSMATVGAAAAGAAAAVGAPQAAQAATPEQGEGYRETAHVKAYLESCRF
jgi:hypothetical protein